MQYLAYHLFQILKKVYLQIWKKACPIFCLSPSSNIKKSILTNNEKNLLQFFTDQFFQILKKVYLQILKKPSTIVCLYTFQILKKEDLKILKRT